MIYIKNTLHLPLKKSRFLSAAKLLLLCQVHKSICYEKIYDSYKLRIKAGKYRAK